MLFNPVLRFGPQLISRLGNDEALGKALSPTEYLTKDSPPTLIFFGTEDWLYAQGQEFVAKSKELGHRGEMFVAEGAKHGFFHTPDWRDKTLARTDEFLASLGYLKASPVAATAAPTAAPAP